MREILFRGKRKDTKKMVYGYFYKGTNAKGKKEPCIWLEYGEMVDAIPETVGQFTGLTFKGVKAFEGDIAKGLFLHGSAILGVVAFQDGAFGLAWKRGNINEFSPFPCMCNVDYEIIGNIHDNPELLEV